MMIKDFQTLFLAIFPWLSSMLVAKTGKYFNDVAKFNRHVYFDCHLNVRNAFSMFSAFVNFEQLMGPLIA